MVNLALSDEEFGAIQRFIHSAAGISLSNDKKALVKGRLASQVQRHGLRSYREYLQLISSGQAEAETQIAVDLLTTNETYFFRENQHFELLRQKAIGDRPAQMPFRVWSAACSSGEEPYSIAMTLADCLPGKKWELVASDISGRVLDRARKGHYPLERCRDIPAHYLKRFCLKGVGPQEGTLLVQRSLKANIRFIHLNLNQALPDIGLFDVVFLRNVMIYFNAATKQQVIERITAVMKPGACLYVGHSEGLNNIPSTLRMVRPSVYEHR
ncbi:CheR family methyltransferase [Noviherbaspirillum galbum]|uniref:Chemotaxis protein methyltransferase n=1 Tax=Noviherbaspirillum galbum TaxID=2709383 RepID=A0A6B3SQV5_9BURK|nr:protein-glutamate O-methyltransferase CheR [Noviherbaspirillum galbum]NEX60792.1 protein-glutamate O-methyltransferase CheR [Noviherbaspirillum galbum]